MYREAKKAFVARLAELEVEQVTFTRLKPVVLHHTEVEYLAEDEVIQMPMIRVRLDWRHAQ